MIQLIMLKGLPASGKSTRAREQVKNGGFKRINKDDLRELIDGGKRSKKNEENILKIRDHIIFTTLIGGTGIIVDDTNFAPHHEENLKKIADDCGAKFIVKSFDTDVFECIKRDMNRAKSVGQEVIRKMHNQYLKKGDIPFNTIPYNDDLPNCIIVDIDGTLARHVARGPFEMDKLHTDECIQPVREIVNSYHVSNHVILMSGREEQYRLKTAKWLQENDVDFEELYMRPTGDTRNDTIIKKELYEKHIKGKFNVMFAIDDRTRIVDQWRELGIYTLDVNQTREVF